ncbi:MAG: endonuclease [Balneola sp.]|nr:endonuclease [Balneola sp.]|tara:strand:- start:39625 stop:39993 length:369 start_codon:yes stop_codon:yes gene_type:complete
MSYYTYIITNSSKSTLYIGMTNDVPSRILEHGLNAGKPKTFAGRYHCYFLLWYEEHKYVQDSIRREKQIKKWSRKKKLELIKRTNPELRFLNEELGLYPFGDYADERNIEYSNRRRKEYDDE